jgi:integrase
MGYLKRVAPKRYRYAYEGPKIDGERKQITGTFYDLTKTEAEAELAKLVEQVRNGEHVKNPNLTLKQLFSEFLEAKARTLALSTYERYESYFRLYIDKALGDIMVRTLRQTHLLDAYAKWSAKGVSGKPLSGRSVRHLHDLLRDALNFGLRREYVTRNVATLIESEDLPKAIRPEPVALDEGETARLLDAARNPSPRAIRSGGLSAEPWFHPAVCFSVYTGARRGEVLALKWACLDLEGGTVTIASSLARTQSRGLFFKSPKNGKARTITLPSPLVAILKEHREKQRQERKLLGAAYKGDDLVFARPDGSLVNPRKFGTRVIQLAERAKVTPITLHCLRDTHASLLANKGVALEVVSKRLGHQDIRTTAERYLHVFRERDAAAASVLDTLCG